MFEEFFRRHPDAPVLIQLAVALAGTGLAAYGAALIYLPAGLVFGGLSVVGWALLADI